MGRILLDLVEMGAEQHQRGGHRRATTQTQSLRPGHRCNTSSRSQHQQSRCSGKRPEGQPTQRLTETPIAQAEGRSLIDKPQPAAHHHQSQRHRLAAPGQPGHQQQTQHQRQGGQPGDAVAPAGEVHHRMGFAQGIHPGLGIEDVVAEVLPEQQQDRRQQKPHQLIPAHQLTRTQTGTGGQQHRHHRHRVHRPFDRSLPQTPPLGVTGCNSLRL